jgi:hypothetical protein
MSERTYSEQEVAALIERVAELQRLKSRRIKTKPDGRV